jgi:hypothetical protein
MRWWLLLAVVGCAPAAPMPPRAPAAPQLDGPSVSPVRLRQATLQLQAEPGVTVRVFTDPACQGPELLRHVATGARDAVTVETVNGRNVFAAHAVSASGLRSACSPPVSFDVRFVLRGDQAAPEFIDVLPSNPSSERTVWVRGLAAPGWTVRIVEGTGCTGEVLATGSAEAFEMTGIPLTLPENGSLRVSMDAERDDWLSRCSVARDFVHDGVPPRAPSAAFFPPPPHPWPVATVVAWLAERERDAVVRITAGPRCDSQRARAATVECASSECVWLLDQVTVETSPQVSVEAVDRAGNRSPCVTLQHEISVEPPPLWVARRLRGDAGSFVALAYPTEGPVAALYSDERCHTPFFRVSTRPLGGLTLVLYANVSPGRVAAVGGPSLTCELLP